MIKLDKDIDEVPTSLIPAFADLFPEGTAIPRTTETTHQKRMEVINNGNYSEEYNDRYKLDDVRNALLKIYKYKCAYCEQKMERYNVEHYRPKATYYWLAFSWDNLIMACPNCNEYKKANFELGVGRTQVVFDHTEANVRLINSSSAGYDVIEKPKMVNPEVTDPHGLLDFQMSGIIESNDERFNYTIKKCQIDRTYLNDDRRKILNVLRRDIRSAMLNSDPIVRKNQIDAIITKFINDSQDDELPFLAFRRFAINKGWLKEILKEIINLY